MLQHISQHYILWILAVVIETVKLISKSYSSKSMMC